MTIKFIILILIIMIQNVFGIEKNTEKYNFIKIQECFIPVPKKYELIDKNSLYEYSYNFCIPNTINCFMLGVNNQNKDSFHKYVYKMKKYIKNIDVSKNYKFKNYSVYKIENKSFNEISYVINRNETTITLWNSSQEELDYLIDYCTSHPQITPQ